MCAVVQHLDGGPVFLLGCFFVLVLVDRYQDICSPDLYINKCLLKLLQKLFLYGLKRLYL